MGCPWIGRERRLAARRGRDGRQGRADAVRGRRRAMRRRRAVRLGERPDARARRLLAIADDARQVGRAACRRQVQRRRATGLEAAGVRARVRAVHAPCAPVLGARAVHDGRQRRAALPQRLDCVEDPESVPHARDAHLLQRDLVELEQHVAADVIVLERRGVVCTPDVRQPARDVRVRPCSEELWVGHPRGQLEQPARQHAGAVVRAIDKPRVAVGRKGGRRRGRGLRGGLGRVIKRLQGAIAGNDGCHPEYSAALAVRGSKRAKRMHNLPS